LNFRRILAIANNVFREVIRDRVLYLAGLFAILMIVAVLLLPEVSAGAQDKIILDVGLVTIDLLGLVVAVFVGTGLVNREIERRTALTLIAKPITRGEFIVGKHLGLSTVLATLVGLTTTFYLIILKLNQIQYPGGTIVIEALYTLLELTLITAVAVLFGVFTSSLIAILLTFATYLIGHFSRDLFNLGQLTESPSIRGLTQAIYLVLPDLSRLDLKNDAVYGSLPSTPALLTHAGYGLLYTALLLTLATWVFSYREF